LKIKSKALKNWAAKALEHWISTGEADEKEAGHGYGCDYIICDQCIRQQRRSKRPNVSRRRIKEPLLVEFQDNDKGKLYQG
jgi:hypothetical protein|tara:strand:- start:5832 stop:6074 length:243 start_codon:yes stop_codon:yes gene_type:complete